MLDLQVPEHNSCVTLGKFLNLSVPWFLIWQVGVVTVPYIEGFNVHRVLSAGPGTKSALCKAVATILDLHRNPVRFVLSLDPFSS